MSTRNVYMPWTMVFADSNVDATFIPVTPWMSTTGIRQLRAPFELAAADSNLEVAPAYQTADVYSDPNATTHDITAAKQSGEGFYFPGDYVDPGSNIKGEQIVRFGYNCILTNSGNPAFAKAMGTVQIVSE